MKQNHVIRSQEDLLNHFGSSQKLEICDLKQTENLLGLNVQPEVWEDALNKNLLSFSQEFVQKIKALAIHGNFKIQFRYFLINVVDQLVFYYDNYKTNKFKRSSAELIQKQHSNNMAQQQQQSIHTAYVILQLWEVELLFLVYYVSNYILKYFATSNADDKFQQIISSWRLFMNYSLTQEGQKYDFDRIRPQSTIQSRYLIFQKGKIEITTCNKRTAMTKINAVEDVQGRSTNSLNKLRQF
ncbi:Hypothetical_protein [Hexamita inflata]|uniref:Hypothetical_protein n=1 Tax=Hexamita inflata TaxID=28002 RepID=A0AA86QWH6_9EUKA|nr:Hypothetical protein HINF_LOCUS53068 [Hexamita inflata]